MIRFVSLLVAAVLGVIVGPVTALWGAGLLGSRSSMSFADVNVDGWMSDWSVGSEAADPYLRARIARHGLLAMRKEGAVYFVRNTDDDGNLLTEACTYRLRGGDQKSYWWSITLYDQESMLPMNNDAALSFDASDVGGSGPWEAVISPEKPETGAWISSHAAGMYDLTLRLYRPTEELLGNPEAHLNPPSVERLYCGSEE